MKAYYQLFKAQPSALFFGWLLTLFSSFGQTFLISLYVPVLLAYFQLSKSGFGGLYAVATLSSSVLLIRFGHYIDHMRLRPFAYRAVSILGLACVILACAVHPALLLLALLGLRFGGQGLLSHISLTVMSRYFSKERGKALSLADLGYSSGELLFPALLGGIMLAWGWRVSAAVSAALIFVILLPLLRVLPLEALDVSAEAQQKRFYMRDYLPILRSQLFWIIMPPTFWMSFTITGLFFYQLLLAEARGWSHAWFAFAFGVYAVVRLLCGLLSGALTDVFSAQRLFPFYLVPMAAGLLVLAYVPQMHSAWLYLALTGVSVGSSGTIKSAVLAESFGTQQLGAVRSLFMMFMVSSTALAPLCFGLLLDRGWSFEQIALLSFGSCLLVSLNALRILKLELAVPQAVVVE